MADRTSAEIFGRFFKEAARQGEIARPMVQFMWSLSKNYDFDPSQMECDRALIKLGLASRGVDPRFPEDGKVVRYEP